MSRTVRSRALELYSVIPNHFIRVKLCSMILASDVHHNSICRSCFQYPEPLSSQPQMPRLLFRTTRLDTWPGGKVALGRTRQSPACRYQPGDTGQCLDFPVRAREDSTSRLPKLRSGSKRITIPRAPNRALHGGDTSEILPSSSMSLVPLLLVGVTSSSLVLRQESEGSPGAQTPRVSAAF